MEENNYYSIYQLLQKIEEFNNILVVMSKRHIISDKKVLMELLVYDIIKNDYNLRKKAINNLEKSIKKFN